MKPIELPRWTVFGRWRPEEVRAIAEWLAVVLIIAAAAACIWGGARHAARLRSGIAVELRDAPVDPDASLAEYFAR
ncbi:MAG: hypothetical protein KF791_10775 [Verrucomicrobiae bacterium]|nr:hypothetical protein [Verrucomicrobiae bacterium]